MGAALVPTDRPAPYGAVHFALSLTCEIAEIEAIAGREGWACHTCNRGSNFGVVELWIENRLMVELLPRRSRRSMWRSRGGLRGRR